VVDKALQEKQSAIVRAQVCKEEEGGRGQRECERMLLTAVSESSSF